MKKIFRKLGYVPYNGFKEELYQLAMESRRRNGQEMNLAGDYGIRVKIKCWLLLP